MTNLPLLPLRDIVVFPHMVAPLFVGRKPSVNALNNVMTKDKKIVLVTQINPEVDSPNSDHLYKVGTLAKVLQLLKLPDGTVIDLSDIMPQPEEERIPVDPTDPNDPMYGIFPGAEPKDLLPPMSLVDAEGNPFVLRHSEQDPITGEVLNNQPFGNVSGTVSLDEIAPPPEPPLTNAELKEKILSGELPMSMAPKPDMQPELPVGIDPIPDPTSSTETTPAPESTPVQGMTMEQMQQMIADMQAQQQEQAATRAAQEKEMTQNYMVPGSRMGYNPYLSGQYQSDPYGPSGVPNMGGITTIPVPDGYGIYNPIYGG